MSLNAWAALTAIFIVALCVAGWLLNTLICGLLDIHERATIERQRPRHHRPVYDAVSRPVHGIAESSSHRVHTGMKGQA